MEDFLSFCINDIINAIFYCAINDRFISILASKILSSVQFFVKHDCKMFTCKRNIAS